MTNNEKAKRKRLIEKYSLPLRGVSYKHFRNMLFILPIALNAKVVVETGVAKGHSTEIFLKALYYTEGHLWSYDARLCENTVQKLKEKELSSLWTFTVMDSVKAGKKWIGKNIDLLYLDSNHREEHVYNELYVWTPYLNNKGIVVIHDTAHPEGIKKSPRSFEGAAKFIEGNEKWNLINLNDPLGMGIIWQKLRQ